MATDLITLKIFPYLNCGEIPQYATSGASGMDVRSLENYLLKVGEIRLFRLGFAVCIPEGYEVQLRPRSGLALKHGITLPNSPATIDSDYRGEVGVILQNTGSFDYHIEVGDRIAQMAVAPVVRARIEIVDCIDDTQRAGGGFGSTGKK